MVSTVLLTVFRAIFISNLLYASETRTLYRKELERSQPPSSKHIVSIKWQDRHPNNVVHNRSEKLNIKAAILKHRLRWWSEHVNRMAPSRLPRTILYSGLVNSKTTARSLITEIQRSAEAFPTSSRNQPKHLGNGSR